MPRLSNSVIRSGPPADFCDPQRQFRFLAGVREPVQLQDAAAHPDPAPPAVHLGDHPGPEQVPAHLRIGQHDHVVQPWRQQRPHSGGPGRPADGVEEHVDVVVAVGPGGFDHDDPVRPDQVVAEGLGPVQQRGRLRARVPGQVEHEVDPTSALRPGPGAAAGRSPWSAPWSRARRPPVRCRLPSRPGRAGRARPPGSRRARPPRGGARPPGPGPRRSWPGPAAGPAAPGRPWGRDRAGPVRPTPAGCRSGPRWPPGGRSGRRPPGRFPPAPRPRAPPWSAGRESPCCAPARGWPGAAPRPVPAPGCAGARWPGPPPPAGPAPAAGTARSPRAGPGPRRPGSPAGPWRLDSE